MKTDREVLDDLVARLAPIVHAEGKCECCHHTDAEKIALRMFVTSCSSHHFSSASAGEVVCARRMKGDAMGLIRGPLTGTERLAAAFIRLGFALLLAWLAWRTR